MLDQWGSCVVYDLFMSVVAHSQTVTWVFCYYHFVFDIRSVGFVCDVWSLYARRYSQTVTLVFSQCHFIFDIKSVGSVTGV